MMGNLRSNKWEKLAVGRAEFRCRSVVESDQQYIEVGQRSDAGCRTMIVNNLREFIFR